MNCLRLSLRLLRQTPLPSFIILVGMLATSLGQVMTLGSTYPILQFFSGGRSDDALTQRLVAFLKTLGLEPSFGAFLILFLFTAFFYAALSFAFEAYQKHYLRRKEESLRGELTRATFMADWPYLRSLVHGEMLNIITREVDNYAKGVVKHSLIVLSSAIQALALLAFAFWVHWRFALSCLVLFGVGSTLFIPIFVLANKMGTIRLKAANAFSAHFLTSLRASKTIKAGSLENNALDLLVPLINQLAKAYYHAGVLEVARSRLNDVLGYLTVVVMAYIGYAVFRLEMPALMVLMLLFFRLLTPLRTALDAYHLAVAHYPAVEIVERKLRSPQAAARSKGVTVLRPPVRTIEFSGITFSQPGASKPLFENLSFKVHGGQVWLISGYTGSGKTTLLDLLLGLYPPEKGRILVNDVSLEELDLTSWHSRIGFLSQEAVVFEGTLRSNLLWGSSNHYSDEILSEALHRAQLDLHLKSPQGLDKEILENGNNLSGGEKQRLALARIFLHQPEVMVFDEPTSALDKETEQGIIDLLAGLKGQVTLFIVSHQPKFRSICDHMVRLEPGIVSHEGGTRTNVG